MATTHLTGNSGSVTLPNTIKVDVTEWSAELDIDEIVVPPALGEKWEQADLGAGRVRGTLRGKVKAGAANKPFDPSGTSWSNFGGATTLTANTGCTVSGTMIFSNIKLGKSRGAYDTFEASFRNHLDDVAVAWA